LTGGRRRQRNAKIPKHIDQSKLPKRIYFDDRGAGVWYTLQKDAAGRLRRQNVAKPDAELSDLHRIAEQLRNKGAGTLRHLAQQFHESKQFADLSDKSRADYEYCRGVVLEFKAKAGPFGNLPAARLTPPVVQVLIDELAKTGPSKAVHALRWLRRLFSWGLPRGKCLTNPAEGVEQPKQRNRRRLPAPATMAAVIAYAAACGRLAAHTKGSCPPYLWAALDIAYLCRLRGIEVVTLTDANALEEGVMTNRRKGSRDNIVRWTPRLRAAWDELKRIRAAAWARRGRATPLRAEVRPLVVSEDGGALAKSALDSAWNRFIRGAIEAGVLPEEERFAPHDLKRRGVTDTRGTRADKQEASGHKNESMMEVYDLSVPIVNPSNEA
jgi:integrase